MIVHIVDHEVREPRVLSRSLEQFIEQIQALLAKVVPEDLEGHNSRVMEE